MKYYLLFLLLLVPLVSADFGSNRGAVYEIVSVNSDFCALGVCLGGLTIPEYIILDGYLSMSGNASIGGDLEVNGSLNVTGNSSVTLFYGEMWNYSSHSSPWTFDITADDVYFNMTNLIAGNLNGFTCVEEVQANGGSYLNVSVSGLYKVCATISFRSTANGGTFGIAIVENFDVSLHRNCYARREASTDIGNAGICCLMDLSANDVINMQVENEDNTRDMVIHTINFNVVRVGA